MNVEAVEREYVPGPDGYLRLGARTSL
jgi:hypothetical protein